MPYAAYVPAAHATPALDMLCWSDSLNSGFSNWDSPVGSKWSHSGFTSHDSNPGPDGSARATGDTGEHDDYLQKTVNATGYENITLSYWYKADDLESSDGDRVYAEYSTDGSTWHAVPGSDIDDDNDDNAWHYRSHTLPSGADGATALRIRFGAHLDHHSDTVWVDQVGLCGDEAPTTGTIIVRKVLGDDIDEDISASDFYFSVNEGEPTPFVDVEGEDWDGERELAEVEPGHYIIEEVGNGGYTPSYDNCEFDLEAGETKICIITNTEVPPAHIIVKKRVQDEPHQGDSFEFTLDIGDNGSQTTTIEGPELTESFFDVFFENVGDIQGVTLDETSLPHPWQFVDVLCWEGDGQRPEEQGETPQPTPTGEPEAQTVLEDTIEFTYADTGAEFTVGSGDVVTCEFTNRRPGGGNQPPTGTLVVEKYIRGGSLSFDEFRFEVDGGSLGFNGYFDESGRNTFEEAPVGEYIVSEEAPENYTASYGGDCDETGVVAVAKDETSVCRVTNTADGWEDGDGEIGPEPTETPDAGSGGDPDGDLGTLIVKKVILFGEDASVSFSDFGFTVGSASYMFEEDGDNKLGLQAGDYAVVEMEASGFTHAFSGDCDENGNVLVQEGKTKTCIITNTAGVGGFNPGSDIPAPIETPTPTPTPTPTGTGGGVTGGSLGGPAGENDDAPASESAPASPSADSLLTASIGSLGDFPLCVPGGLWWVLVNLVLYFLAILWLQRGEFNLGKAVIVLVLLAAVLIWVANACTNNPLWLPAALSVLAFLWLRLRGTQTA